MADADSKMAALEEPPVEEKKSVEDLAAAGVGDESSVPPRRVRKESEGYGITEEQEKKLLAEDDEDLDVITCYVEDFDSDIIEHEKKEVQDKQCDEPVHDGKDEKVEVFQVVSSAGEESESGEKQDSQEATAPTEEVDEDVIQIDEDTEMLLEHEVSVEQPTHASDETKNARILSKPLVKQVVIDVQDEPQDLSNNQRSPEKDSIDEGVGRSSTTVETQEDSDAEQPMVIADAVDSCATGFIGCQPEDPDVLQLKLDLYQSMGEMDYESDEGEKMERKFRIKEEPLSPVEDRLERIQLDLEDIPTIELLTSDEDDLSRQQEPIAPKKSKRKSKKRSKQRSVVEDDQHAGPAPVKSTTSVKSVGSSESGTALCMNEELYKTGFRMELRKRKSMPHLEEKALSPIDKRRKSSCAVKRSRSKGSVISTASSNVCEDISAAEPAEKLSAESPTFKPLSSEDKLKINSLFADCEKQVVQPEITLDAMESILDDGKPLIESKVAEPKVPKLLVSNKQAPRQIKIIEALPRSVLAAKGSKPHDPGETVANQSRKLPAPLLVPKPDFVPEVRQQVIQSLEEDLAMSSSDDEMLRQVMPTSVRSRPLDMPMVIVHGKEAPKTVISKKRGRKRRIQPQNQRINDNFCLTTGDNKDACNAVCCQPDSPIGKGAAAKKPTVKRKRKRRISSSCSEDETTESISLGGDSTTTAMTRSNTTVEDDGHLAAESAPETDPVESDRDSSPPTVPPTQECSVVLLRLSPTTEQLNGDIEPEKVRTLSQATQTEMKGLTWSFDLGSIDFYSEYFEKCYQLITMGRERQSRMAAQTRRNNNFEEVIIAGRGVVESPSPPVAPNRVSPTPNPSRSNVEQLLFQRAVNEVQLASSARVDQRERERMERSVASNFRIPKVLKQPSSSPQDVTSSTPHENDSRCKEEEDSFQNATANGVEQAARPSYSNDRPIVSDPRRNVAAGATGRSSPPRFEDAIISSQRVGIRPENEHLNGSAAAIDNLRPLAMRRTIRNDHVQQQQQQQQVAQPNRPLGNGFPSYSGPEPQYQQGNGSNFQQQQQQRGGYMSQEMDIKPNLSALANQFVMMNNPARYLHDYFNFLYQINPLTQQLPAYPPINPGPMFPPLAANFAPNLWGSQMMQGSQQPFQPEQSTSSAGQRYARDSDVIGTPTRSNEPADQIGQIFGCYDQLTGRCPRNPCQYSHTLPSNAHVFQMLSNGTQELVMSTYRFVAGRDDLFLKYFPVYAEVMGRANLRHQLVDAIVDCERPKRAYHFYRHIVDGLTINGTLSRDRAVKIVLEKHTKKNFDQINVLVSLILETEGEIPQFLQWLDEFSRVSGYQYEAASINRLVEFCVRTSGPNMLHCSVVEVAKLTYRLLLEVVAGREPSINSGTLLDFVKLLSQSNLGLNVENIINKYRENEMFTL